MMRVNKESSESKFHATKMHVCQFVPLEPAERSRIASIINDVEYSHRIAVCVLDLTCGNSASAFAGVFK